MTDVGALEALSASPRLKTARECAERNPDSAKDLSELRAIFFIINMIKSYPRSNLEGGAHCTTTKGVEQSKKDKEGILVCHN